MLINTAEWAVQKHSLITCSVKKKTGLFIFLNSQTPKQDRRRNLKKQQRLAAEFLAASSSAVSQVGRGRLIGSRRPRLYRAAP